MNLKKLDLIIAAGIFALFAGHASANEKCLSPTIKPGILTVATGNPTYFPWVLDDDPKSGKGFEAAVAYEVAARMGYPADKVEWVRTSFDQAIQPGAKDFDFNLQQYSITTERAKVIDFSTPYYTAARAVLVRKPVVAAGAVATVASIRKLVWGAVAGSTAPGAIKTLIGPAAEPSLFDDTADISEALKAGQIDATLLDLPTALYMAAAVLDDGVVLGQFPHGDEETGLDQFGLVFEKGNPLRVCADAAIAGMVKDGKLAAIEAEWLQNATGVPLIK
ncbi:amino acid ABC transporter substrate-binding protein (plasmid) [Rhizobium lusitanum]|nr:amino acid ABC transporter substrate-binding protein [Rhizobium lusitanum]